MDAPYHIDAHLQSSPVDEATKAGFSSEGSSLKYPMWYLHFSAAWYQLLKFITFWVICLFNQNRE